MDHRQNHKDRSSPFLSSKINDVLVERYSANNESDFSHRRPSKYTINQQIEVQELENELEQAISKIELLQSEKNQLKSTIKLILDQQGPDVAPFQYGTGSGQKHHNPASNSYKEALINDMERRLISAEKETNELRICFQNKIEEANALRQDNEYYREKISEVDRMSIYNSQVKDEMSKLNKEMLAISNRVKELEEENRQLSGMVPGDASTSQSIRYINFCLSLLEDFDSQHYTRACFKARFKDGNQIQTLVSQKQLVVLGLKAFRYITDLLVNISMNEICTNSMTKTEAERRQEMQRQLESTKLLSSHIMNDKEIRDLKEPKDMYNKALNTPNIHDLSNNLSKSTSDTKNKQSWSYKKDNIRIDTPRTNDFDTSTEVNANEKEVSPRESSKASRSTVQTIANSMAKASLRNNDRNKQPLKSPTHNFEMLRGNEEVSRPSISNQNSRTSSRHHQNFVSATPQHKNQPMNYRFSSPQNINFHGNEAPRNHLISQSQAQEIETQTGYSQDVGRSNKDPYNNYYDNSGLQPEINTLPQPHSKPTLPPHNYSHNSYPPHIVTAIPIDSSITPEYVLDNQAQQPIYGRAASPFNEPPIKKFLEANNHPSNQYNLQQRAVSHGNILSDHLPYYENNSIPLRQHDLQARFINPNSPSNNRSVLDRRISSPANFNMSHRGGDADFADRRNSATTSGSYRAGEGKTPSLPGSLVNSHRDLSKSEEGAVYKQVFDPQTGFSRLERVNIAPVGSHAGNHYFFISGQKDDRERPVVAIPEEVEVGEAEKGEDFVDKQTQVRKFMIEGPDRDNCKETQTSMSSRTPENTTRRKKEIPDLRIQEIVNKIEDLEQKKSMQSKKWQHNTEPNTQAKSGRDNSQGNSFMITHDKQRNEHQNDDSWENSVDSKKSNRSKSASRSVSFDDEKKRCQPKDQKKSPSILTESDRPKKSRATLGVMGNVNNSSNFSPNKSSAIHHSSEDNSSPLLTPQTGKSFRVSFGKTQSFNLLDGKEKAKPRFDIVPNDLICIVEAPTKGRNTPAKPRAWNIITNEAASLDAPTTGGERLNSGSLAAESSKNVSTTPRTAT